MTGSIDPQPRRTWVSNDPQSKIRCHLGMSGRVTLGEVYNHFVQHYPDVDFWHIEWSAASVTWEDEPTEEESKKRAEWGSKQRARTEEWERKTFARLKAKFEPDSAQEET